MSSVPASILIYSIPITITSGIRNSCGMNNNISNVININIRMSMSSSINISISMSVRNTINISSVLVFVIVSVFV